MSTRLLLTILLLGVLTMSHALADFTLVRDGKPLATIVIAADAGDKVKVAAADLQAYVAKLSGAKLPLATDAAPPAGPLVLVGASKLTAGLDVKILAGATPAFREEGFVIWCRGDRLVLAGNNDGPYHGTEYAVYEFLNRLGVRWYMPGEFGEVVPQKSTLACPELTVSETPDFLMRDWWHHIKPEWADQERRWKIRNKMNPDRGDFFYTPGDSSVRQVLDPTRFKTEPELFALNEDGTRNPHFPNLTNPEAVKMVAGKVKEWLRKNPGKTSYGFAPDDGLPRDFNPETVKQSLGFPILGGRPGVPAEMSVTEEWIRFFNQVCAEVHQEFPGVYLSTNGYANRNNPPLNVTPDPKTVVMFAAIWSCTLHGYEDPKCWQKTLQGQMLQEWTRQCPNVWIYGYTYNMLVSGLALVPEFTKLRRDFPLLKKWGAIGFLDETRNVWAESGIGSRYLRAKLEWDADADVDALLNDFFAQWYGPAGPAMQRFYYALDAAITNNPVHGHEDRCLPELYTPELMKQLGRELFHAKQQAAAEPYRTRVRAEELIYDHLQAYVAMNQAELTGDFAGAARAAEKVLAVRTPLHQISPFFIWPDENGYHTGVWYWKIIDRAKWYTELAERQYGPRGDKASSVPTDVRGRYDVYDTGVNAGWWKSGLALSSDWKPIGTTRPAYAQLGRGNAGETPTYPIWYRMKVNVPASFRGRKLMLCAPTVATEAWCWINGQFVGHRPYLEAYIRPAMMELDVTDAVKPGQTNELVFRVSPSLGSSQDAEGIYGTVFLYAPK